MAINKEMAKAVVDFLNEALKVDKAAVEALFSFRAPCNQAMADHPTIQVRSYGPDPKPNVGFLGLLNGLCGADENNIGDVGLNGEWKKPDGIPNLSITEFYQISQRAAEQGKTVKEMFEAPKPDKA